MTGGAQGSSAGVARVYAVSSEGRLDAASPELDHGAPVTFAAFDRTGDRLVTVTGDADVKRGEAKVWDRTGRPLSTLAEKDGAVPAHSETVRCAAFSLDGKLVVTASEDDTAALWDPATGSLRARLGGKTPGGVPQGHTADVVSATFSDSGDRVITSGEDGLAIIWDTTSGKQLTVLTHLKPVKSALFSRDARHVMTACRDGAARIWSIKGGRAIGLSRQPGAVLELGYSGDESGAMLGVFSFRSPFSSGETDRRDAASHAPLASSNFELGVGMWDLAPGANEEFAQLAEFAHAIAARRISARTGEMEPISPTERDRAWDQASKAEDIRGRPPTAGEWHDHMATACEAQRRWTAAIWHLTQLQSLGEDLPSTYLRRAQAHRERGRADGLVREASLIQATDDLDRVLLAQPGNGRAFLERADIELERNKWTKALEDFSEAERSLGGNKRLWMGRAQAHVGRKEWQAAIADYDRALGVDPEDGTLHKKLAEACVERKDWQRAGDEYERAAQCFPGELGLRERRAAALAKQPHKSSEAIQEYAAVARLYRSRRQFEEAKNAFGKAITLKKMAPATTDNPKPDRDRAALHAELADSLSRLAGHSDEAILNYNEALATEPTKWEYWRGLAQVCQSNRAWDKAKEAYSRAISLQPGEAALRVGRAWSLRQLKDWDGAAQDYESAIKLTPTNVFLYLWLADTHLEAGKLEEVKRCLELGSKVNPSSEQFPRRLAIVHLLQKDPAGYRAICERMLNQFDAVKDPNIANNVAWVCALAPNAVQDSHRAVSLAKRAVELVPRNTNFLDTLGAVLYRSGDFEGTIERLSASGFSSRPDRTALFDRLFLAMACHGAGRTEDAEVLLEEVIQQLKPHQAKTGGPPQALETDVGARKELELLREEAEKLIKPSQ